LFVTRQQLFAVCSNDSVNFTSCRMRSATERHKHRFTKTFIMITILVSVVFYIVAPVNISSEALFIDYRKEN